MPPTKAQAKALKDTHARLLRARFALSRLPDDASQAAVDSVVGEFVAAEDEHRKERTKSEAAVRP